MFKRRERRLEIGNYYQKNLNADGLYQVYQTGIPRIEQYLRAETDYVKERLDGTEHILEIGTGYGRIMRELAPAAAYVTGIEISEDSVLLGKFYLQDCNNCRLLTMDAHKLDFHKKRVTDTIRAAVFRRQTAVI